ncbi:MAG: lmo0937 family membrane protein [Flavitalea sp.]
MGNLLYIIAVILIIAWAVGFLALHVTGSLIHVLLVIAVVLFVFKLITGRSNV